MFTIWQFQQLMKQAESFEEQNNLPEALQCYRQAAALLPGNAVPDTKISTLTARRQWGPPPLARSRTVERPRVTMSTLGQNGRFGNQIFQYAYLRLYASNCGAAVETSDWIGRDLFSIDDPLVTSRLPSLHEGSFDAALALRGGERPAANVDLVGYFQMLTVTFRPRMAEFRRLFRFGGGV
jgi:hypothetical protein